MADPPSSNLTPRTAARDAAKFTASSIGQGVIWQAAVKAAPYVTGLVAALLSRLDGLSITMAILLGLGVAMGLSLVLLIVSLSVHYFRTQSHSIPAANDALSVMPDSQEIQRLKSEIEGLQGELVREAESAEEREKSLQLEKQELEQQKTQLSHELKNARESKLEWERDYHKANNKAKEVSSERDNYELRLKTANIEKNSLKEDLEKAQREAKQANLRANQETNQREEFIRLYYDSERKLGELKWLEGRMKDQAENLDKWVRINKRIALKLQLSETPRMVIFVFWVRNNSIFNITLDFNDMTGRLQFKNRPYRDPVRLPPHSSATEDVEPGGSIEITLEQPLLETEAETILASRRNGDVNGIFWLGNLKIPISPTGIPQSFKPKNLTIHPEIEHMNISDFRNTDIA